MSKRYRNSESSVKSVKKKIRSYSPTPPYGWFSMLALDRIYRSTEIKPLKAARAVYFTLCELAAEYRDNIFQASVSYIAQRAALSSRCTGPALLQLEAAGLIIVQRRHVKGTNANDINIYKLVAFIEKKSPTAKTSSDLPNPSAKDGALLLPRSPKTPSSASTSAAADELGISTACSASLTTDAGAGSQQAVQTRGEEIEEAVQPICPECNQDVFYMGEPVAVEGKLCLRCWQVRPDRRGSFPEYLEAKPEDEWVRKPSCRVCDDYCRKDGEVLDGNGDCPSCADYYHSCTEPGHLDEARFDVWRSRQAEEKAIGGPQ